MNVRKLLIAFVAAVYGLLFTGGIISYAFLREPPPAAGWAGPLFLYSAFALVLLSSGTRLAWWLFAAAVGGFAAELIGLHSTAVFGEYSYTTALGWQILGVPAAIGAAWGVLLAYAAGLSSLWPRIRGALLGASWMVAADLLIDPLASGPLAYWQWSNGGPYYGVPLTNFIGWFCVSYALLLLAPRREPMPREHRPLGLSVIAFYGLLALVHGSTAPLALIGIALIILDVVIQRLVSGREAACRSPFAAAKRSEYVLRTEMPCSAQLLFRWHLQPAAFSDLQPPWQKMVIESIPRSITAGERVHIVLLLGPLRVPWVSEITNVTPGRQFVDEQQSGPWAYWRHEHNFIATGDDSSIMEDRIVYALPGGTLAEIIGGWLVEWQLHRVFSYRHRVLLGMLNQHQRHRAQVN